MKFNFTSQICTTEEQSEQLLALGLKKETADMHYPTISEDEHTIRACWEDFWDSRKAIDGYIRRRCTPAWSLHRLLEMMPQGVIIAGTEDKLSIDSHLCVEYILEETQSRVVMSGELSNPIKYIWKGGVFDRIVCCIYWLIEEGYFNKEYLEE